FVVMQSTKPIGIVRSHDMFRILGTHYGVALHYKKKMREVMYPDILAVDWNTTIDEVSRKSMERNYEDIYDDVVVTDQGEFVGVIPVYELLTYMTELKVREAAQKNPLSGLPGNERIIDMLDKKKQQGKDFSVLYIDIDHFKAFNDVYGFKHGDEMIVWTSRLLQDCDSADMFIGHIGGDDFLAIVWPDQAEHYCKEVIDRFEQGKLKFYSELDINNNFIMSLDRNHQWHRFPLVSLTIAIVDLRCTLLLDVSDIPALAAGIKKQAKQIEGSVYFREQLPQL
ncbi:MAG: diguanylate cyclase/phosphodiesterase, partial [Bacilli bacterium]|nr:diguanylate cyclase/phosphodiesterase [Bacilli bacterium]